MTDKISDKDKTKAQLLAELSSLKEALDAISDGFIVFDEEDRVVAYNSKQTELFPSVAAHLSVGMPYRDLITAQANFGLIDAARGREAAWIEERLRQHQATTAEPVEQVFADGKIVRLSRHRTSSGGIVAVRSDITDLKLAQEELQENQEKFAKAFNANPLICTITTLDEGRYVDINPAFERITGYDRAEIIGRTVRDVNIWPDPNFRKRLVSELGAKGAVTNLEAHFQTKSGEIRDTYLSMQIMEIGGVTCILGYFPDATEEKKAVQALRDSEEKYRNLTDGSRQGVLIANREREVLFCNQATAEIFGYQTPQEIMALPNSLDLIAPVDRERISQFREARFDDVAASSIIEFQGARKNGDIVHIQAVQRILNWEGQAAIQYAMIDVSERKNAESRYRDLIEVSPDAIFIHRDGNIVFANRKANEVYGAESHGGLMGLPAIRLVHPGFRDQVNSRRLEISATDGFLPFVELTHLTLDGQPVELEVTGRKIVFEGGPAILTYAREIGDRKELQRRLDHAQRMEAVGQLTGGVAHDFNNLLAVLIGNAEILGGFVEGDDEAMGHIETIIRTVDRASSLTNRLLAFSRQQTLAPVATDTIHLIASLEDMLQRTLGETVELRVEPNPDLWSATIDPHQFENALINLSINARDALPGGGTLVIETANVALDEVYARQHEEVAPGDYVVVAVRDSGTGMSPEVLKKVFEPFFTTKDVGKGSGLGLSMVYGFAKQSKGHVTIDSEVDFGTTVKLYLPRAPQAVAQEGVECEAPAHERGSERILVVEDDQSVRKVSVSLLRNQGYEVVEAERGAAAIRQIKSDRPFDLLFVDVVLPGGMNGVEVAEEALRLQPSLKVLYTTGYAENAVVQQGRLDPSATLVNKPYRRAELLDKVRAMLDAEA